jgi:hypothetical protein
MQADFMLQPFLERFQLALEVVQGGDLVGYAGGEVVSAWLVRNCLVWLSFYVSADGMKQQLILHNIPRFNPCGVTLIERFV